MGPASASAITLPCAASLYATIICYNTDAPSSWQANERWAHTCTHHTSLCPTISFSRPLWPLHFWERLNEYFSLSASVKQRRICFSCSPDPQRKVRIRESVRSMKELWDESKAFWLQCFHTSFHQSPLFTSISRVNNDMLKQLVRNDHKNRAWSRSGHQTCDKTLNNIF